MGKNEDLDAEIARLSALGLDQLGQDILRRAWAPDGPAKKGEAELHEIAKGLDPTGGSRFGVDGDKRELLYDLIREGVQALTHAGLVMWEHHGGDTGRVEFRLTRRGRAALGQPA